MKVAESVRTFTTGEAARFSGIPHRTVDYWSKIGLVVPTVADTTGSGVTRRYDFADLLALRLVKELRRAGISIQALRSAVKQIRGVKNPFAECRLLAIGRTVVWIEDRNNIVDVYKKVGQQSFTFMVFDYPAIVQEIDAEVEKHHRAA